MAASWADLTADPTAETRAARSVDSSAAAKAAMWDRESAEKKVDWRADQLAAWMVDEKAGLTAAHWAALKGKSMVGSMADRLADWKAHTLVVRMADLLAVCLAVSWAAKSA